ncbi:MAG: 4Fe-4S dicluster domain-containing protein [Candidatus Bathyarchaeota archaeon]|nr:4Fe-4S dicluster domain-containing protein [Candidatus Bathyarchaeota archaeon]
MLTHYGYIDASGEYFIIVDSDKCTGCANCVKQCPKNAFELVTEFIDLEDKTVAAITDQHRKKINYTCTPCKPETNQTPCTKACNQNAIQIIWKPN